MPSIGFSTYDSQIMKGGEREKVPGEEREMKHGYVCEKSRIVMMGGTPESFLKLGRIIDPLPQLSLKAEVSGPDVRFGAYSRV